MPALLRYPKTMTSSAAAHRLVSTLPLQSLPDLVGSAPFVSPCHDDEGRDLVFSALRNPDWKTARAHKEAAQSALLAWLPRKDVDPFAPQLLRSPASKAKKGAPKEKAYASSFQLALELGLESLAIGMLSSASPERLAVLRASEQGRQVLEAALAKNMVGLVKQAAASGWEVRHLDAKGRSLLWQARSVEAVRALLEAGLPGESLSEPGLVEALGKSIPQKQTQPWMQLLESHSSPASLVGPSSTPCSNASRPNFKVCGTAAAPRSCADSSQSAKRSRTSSLRRRPNFLGPACQ